MNLTELCDAVASKSRRPDKAEEILLAVQEATLFAHHSDFYRRDIVEIPLVYTQAAFKGQVDFNRQLPGLRKVAYWRKFDPLTCAVGEYLKPVEPDQLLDQFRNQKLDRYYLAGKVINWISSTGDKAHLVGYYKRPPIAKSDYDSWIGDNHPFILINYAAGIIFGQIGQQDEKKAHQELALAQIAELLTDEIESEGR